MNHQPRKRQPLRHGLLAWHCGRLHLVVTWPEPSVAGHRWGCTTRAASRQDIGPSPLPLPRDPSAQTRGDLVSKASSPGQRSAGWSIVRSAQHRFPAMPCRDTSISSPCRGRGNRPVDVPVAPPPTPFGKQRKYRRAHTPGWSVGPTSLCTRQPHPVQAARLLRRPPAPATPTLVPAPAALPPPSALVLGSDPRSALAPLCSVVDPACERPT